MFIKMKYCYKIMVMVPHKSYITFEKSYIIHTF